MIIDYYAGAYGPTLRFDLRTPADLTVTRDAFGKMAEGDTQCLTFHELKDVILYPTVSAVYLELLPDPKETRKSLTKVERLGGTEFRWRCTVAGWHLCLDLCDTLVPQSHQYLTEDGDDVLMEIAFLER